MQGLLKDLVVVVVVGGGVPLPATFKVCLVVSTWQPFAVAIP